MKRWLWPSKLNINEGPRTPITEEELERRSEKLFRIVAERFGSVQDFSDYTVAVSELVHCLKDEAYFGVGDSFFKNLEDIQLDLSATDSPISAQELFVYQVLVVTERVRSAALRRAAQAMPNRPFESEPDPSAELKEATDEEYPRCTKAIVMLAYNAMSAGSGKKNEERQEKFTKDLEMILSKTTDFATDNPHIQDNFMSILVIAAKSGVRLPDDIHIRVRKARKKSAA